MRTDMIAWIKKNQLAFVFLVAVYGMTVASLLLGMILGQGSFTVIEMSCLVLLLTIMLALLLLDSRLRNIVGNYFSGTSHPLNLAIFRIVLFGYLLNHLDLNTILWFSRLPSELQFAPMGTEWFLKIIPVNESLAKNSYVLFRLFCVTGMIGLCTRFSALMVTLLGFYTIGIPQFFGFVTHYNHLIWFSAILAVSGAGDYYSVDALGKACRRADQGIIDPPQAARNYALSLRFVWILIGIIYFFPGFWKLWLSGHDWIFGDALKLKLYQQWSNQVGWTPVLYIDQYPVLCRLGGLATIIFEIGFIFLIFFPRLRLIAAALGLVFHNVTDMIMRILFMHLQVCYVAFVDWHAVFNRIGRWVFKKDMTVIYDGNCELCRRTVAILRVFDVFDRVRYLNALEPQTERTLKAYNLTMAEALTDMCAVIGTKTYKGYGAYRILAFRIPVLWPLLPLLFLWPVPQLGQWIYRKVADHRACRISKENSSSVQTLNPTFLKANFGLVAVGLILILVNVHFGIRQIGYSWPFACYPTFASKATDTISTLKITLVDKEGGETDLDTDSMRRKYGPKHAGLLAKIFGIQDSQEKEKRLKAAWKIFFDDTLDIQTMKAIRFYKVSASIIPEQQHLNPLQTELIYELNLAQDTSGFLVIDGTMQ